MCHTPSARYCPSVRQPLCACNASICCELSVPKTSACDVALPGAIHCTRPRCEGSTSNNSEYLSDTPFTNELHVAFSESTAYVPSLCLSSCRGAAVSHAHALPPAESSSRDVAYFVMSSPRVRTSPQVSSPLPSRSSSST